MTDFETVHDLRLAFTAKSRAASMNAMDACIALDQARREVASTAAAAAWMDQADTKFGDEDLAVIAAVEVAETQIVAARTQASAAADATAGACAEALAMASRHVEIAGQGGAGTAYAADTGPVQAAAPTATAEPKPAAAKPVKDGARVGKRIILGDGETFAGSVKGPVDDNTGKTVVAAAVDGPEGRKLHVAEIYTDDVGGWKGANAPPTDEVPNENYDPDDPDDEETSTVDTYADATVVVDAADVVTLPDQVAEMMTKAAETDKEYKRLCRQSDQLDRERQKLEGERFDDPADVEEMRRAEADINRENRTQKSRRKTLDECRDRLPPDKQARYDALQEQIDSTGKHGFEPGNDEQAAAACEMTVDEYREMRDLEGIPYQRRHPNQERRLDELRERPRPQPLAEQAALVMGLDVDEFRELEALDLKRPPPTPGDLAWAERHGLPAPENRRTADEQARYEELRSRPDGVNFGTEDRTWQKRGEFVDYQRLHHGDKADLADAQERLASVEGRAGPLPEEKAARLEQVRAEAAAIDARIGEMGGYPSATVEVAGKDGKTLVFQAVQGEEEGGVNFEVGVRPADADDDWSPGNGGDSYMPTKGQVKTLASNLAGLAEA